MIGYGLSTKSGGDDAHSDRPQYACFSVSQFFWAYAGDSLGKRNIVQPGANGEVLLIENKPLLKVRAKARATVRAAKDLTRGRKNKLCKRCRKECEQSNLAKILRCPQFEAKDGK